MFANEEDAIARYRELAKKHFNLPAIDVVDVTDDELFEMVRESGSDDDLYLYETTIE